MQYVCCSFVLESDFWSERAEQQRRHILGQTNIKLVHIIEVIIKLKNMLSISTHSHNSRKLCKSAAENVLMLNRIDYIFQQYYHLCCQVFILFILIYPQNLRIRQKKHTSCEMSIRAAIAERTHTLRRICWNPHQQNKAIVAHNKTIYSLRT